MLIWDIGSSYPSGKTFDFVWLVLCIELASETLMFMLAFRQGAKQWDAIAKWNAQYLREVLHGKQVRVATTPKGNADAVVGSADGTLMFAEPHEAEEDFGEFLDYVQEDASHSSARNVKYAQPREF